MKMRRNSALAAAALLTLPALTQAATLYSQNFDLDDTANWTFNTPISGDTATDNNRNEANVFFDYSTVGIPVAPSGGGTFGLKVEANVYNGGAGGAFTGASLSPTGLSLPTEYILRADVWQNTVGPMPGGGSGSTQLTTMTVGASGTSSEFAGSTITGVQGSASGDGGTTQDYRAYSGAFPDGAGAMISPSAHPGTYAAGDVTATAATDSRNNTEPTGYYTSRFPGQAPPAAQTTLYPAKQTGTSAAGTQAFKWKEWVMVKATDAVTFYIDGKLIWKVDSSLFPASFGNNIALGQADINATNSTDADSRALLFGLFDNVRVESIPEPASMGLLMLGGIALLGRRRMQKA